MEDALLSFILKGILLGWGEDTCMEGRGKEKAILQANKKSEKYSHLAKSDKNNNDEKKEK